MDQPLSPQGFELHDMKKIPKSDEDHGIKELRPIWAEVWPYRSFRDVYIMALLLIASCIMAGMISFIWLTFVSYRFAGTVGSTSGFLILMLLRAHFITKRRR